MANAEGRLAEVFAGEAREDHVRRAGHRAAGAHARASSSSRSATSDRALVFYRRAHAFEPDAKDGTFEAIDRLLREAGRAKDRVALYRESLESRSDPRDRLEALHTIARIEEGELSDCADAAIATYTQALEVDEGGPPHPRSALAQLFVPPRRAGGAISRTDPSPVGAPKSRATLPEDEARFRMDPATAARSTKLSETDAAIDELHAVVELAGGAPTIGGRRGDPDPRAAARDGRAQAARVVEILRSRSTSARTTGGRSSRSTRRRLSLATDDRPERIGILRETARLWEERGKSISVARSRPCAARVDACDARKTGTPASTSTGSPRRPPGGTTSRRRTRAAIEEDRGHDATRAPRCARDPARQAPRRSAQGPRRVEPALVLDESDLQPLEEMDALATLLSGLAVASVRVLTRKAELVPDDEDAREHVAARGAKRSATCSRTSTARSRPTSARSRSSRRARSRWTASSRILYEGTRATPRGWSISIADPRRSSAGKTTRASSSSSCSTRRRGFEADLDDRREAIESLNQALAVRPADAGVLGKLDALYTRERLWPELLENLRLQAASAPEDAGRKALKKRIAALHAVELQDPLASLEAYREVLDAGFDAEAAAAVRALGEAHDELRSDAADALEPVLRQAGRFEDLAGILELRLRAQSEPSDRARTLRSLAEVAEASLSDVGRAESALLRALAEEPQDPTLHAEIERLAARSGPEGWRRYADALQERAGSALRRERRGRSVRAAGRGERGAPRRPDARREGLRVRGGANGRSSRAVLAALDRLFTRLGDAQALADVLERRVAVEGAAETQADLLHRLATAQIRDFGERATGLATLRQALERQPSHVESRRAIEGLLDDSDLFDEAFEALEQVLRSLDLHEDMATLYERRVRRAQTARDRVRARLDLAHWVLEEHVGDSRQWGAARRRGGHPRRPGRRRRAHDALSGLADSNGGGSRRRARSRTPWRRAKSCCKPPAPSCSMRLAGWWRDKLGEHGARRRGVLAGAGSRSREPRTSSARSRTCAVPRGASETWCRALRARAKLESDLGTKRELLREAKAIAEGPVGDRELAEATLRDLVAEDEADLWALEELSRLCVVKCGRRRRGEFAAAAPPRRARDRGRARPSRSSTRSRRGAHRQAPRRSAGERFVRGDRRGRTGRRPRGRGAPSPVRRGRPGSGPRAALA